MANQALAVRVLAEPERTLAFGSISGAFAAVGSPTSHAALQIAFQNLTDSLVSFSLDGVNNAITLAAGSSYVFDIQANKGVAQAMMIGQGTQFWVKNTTIVPSTTGSVYISVFYASNPNNI